MFAFNFNILFPDEPSLGRDSIDPAKGHIEVRKSREPLHFEAFPHRSPYAPMSGREAAYGANAPFSHCQKGCRWGVDIKEVMSLSWVCGESTITYMPKEKFTAELLQFWILHTILPLIFTLEERYTFLHVGSVEIEGAPVIFSADSFGGKSTLTDYFIQKGHPMLSDDSLGTYAENGEIMAVASYPFHRPYRETEALGYPVSRVMKGAKALTAVYLLEQSDPDAAVEIVEVKGIEKYKAFHYSTFVNLHFRKEKHFQSMNHLIKTLPLFKVSIPWKLERLDEVYRAIVTHSRGV